MARKFVRNITGTNLGGSKLNKNEDKIEPFDTNVQNDILNDEEDIFIRQEKSDKVDDGYICLTDNIKNITSGNDVTEVEHTDKNEMHIETKETIITSKPDLINVSKLSTNNYELEVPKANKDEAEKGTSNSKTMTPLQTKNAIEYNNVNVIPDLVKEHETETEITSNTENLIIDKKGKNNFEIDLELPSVNEDGLNNHINDKDNPHNVTKKQIGLEKVSNLFQNELQTKQFHIDDGLTIPSFSNYNVMFLICSKLYEHESSYNEPIKLKFHSLYSNRLTKLVMFAPSMNKDIIYFTFDESFTGQSVFELDSKKLLIINVLTNENGNIFIYRENN